jgi:hypothetical protein
LFKIIPYAGGWFLKKIVYDDKRLGLFAVRGINILISQSYQAHGG